MILNAQNFNFDAKPQVVAAKPKYRENPQKVKHLPPKKIDKSNNLMFEKRVVRGNTYSTNLGKTGTSAGSEVKDAAKPLGIKHGTVPMSLIAPPKIRKTTKAQRASQIPIVHQQFVSIPDEPVYKTTKALQLKFNPKFIDQNNQIFQISKVQEIQRFVNQDEKISTQTQTQKFREILMDKPPNQAATTQTDLLLNKPTSNKLKIPESLIRPVSTKGTQITEEDGLIDFDEEVEPIISVLVMRSLELARMEVLEEEELRIMKEQARGYEQLKLAELADVQRLEANERRLEEEMARRNVQSELVVHRQVATHQQLCCRVLSKSYLGKLMGDSFYSLEEFGYFSDPGSLAIQSQYVPWLYDEVFTSLNKHIQYSEIVGWMGQHIEDSDKDLHINALDSKEAENHRKTEEQRLKLEAKAKRSQDRKNERKRVEEERQLQELREKMTKLFVRDNKVRSKNLVISEMTGIEASMDKEIVGTPGGILFELYLLLDVYKRISSTETNPSVLLDVNLVKNLLKVIGDTWASNDFKFEIAVDEGFENSIMDRKDELFGEDTVVNNFGNVFELIEKLKGDEAKENADDQKKFMKRNTVINNDDVEKEVHKETEAQAVSAAVNYDITQTATNKAERKILFSYLLGKHMNFFLHKATQKYDRFVPEDSIEFTKENAVMGSMSKENTVGFENTDFRLEASWDRERTFGDKSDRIEIERSGVPKLKSDKVGSENIKSEGSTVNYGSGEDYFEGWDYNLLSMVKEGILRYVLSDSQKGKKLFSFIKISREIESDNMPCLCYLHPSNEEEYKKVNEDDKKQDDVSAEKETQKNIRPWLQKNAKEASVINPVKQFWERKFEYQAVPNLVSGPDHDALIVNEPFLLGLRKELVAATALTTLSVLAGDKESQKQIIRNLWRLSQNTMDYFVKSIDSKITIFELDGF